MPTCPAWNDPKNEPVPLLVDGEKLNHASTNRDFNVGNNVFAVEDDLRGSGRCVYQIDQAIKHARRKRPALRIMWNQLHIHGAHRTRDRDGA